MHFDARARADRRSYKACGEGLTGTGIRAGCDRSRRRRTWLASKRSLRPAQQKSGSEKPHSPDGVATQAGSRSSTSVPEVLLTSIWRGEQAISESFAAEILPWIACLTIELLSAVSGTAPGSERPPVVVAPGGVVERARP